MMLSRLGHRAIFLACHYTFPIVKLQFRTAAFSTMGAPDVQKIDTTQRLATLRGYMSSGQQPVDVYLIPSEDAHYSEYTAYCDRRREFVTGFTGSAGYAIVTSKNAYLFTDGRYFLQAEQQLDKNWTLMKQGLPDVPTPQEFLAHHLDSNSKVGVDPTVISAADAISIKDSLKSKGSHLISLDQNLVDAVWDEHRPSKVKNKVTVLDVKFAGQKFQDKLARLREDLSKNNVVGIVVNMLDELAWLFNLRGSDVEFNPVFFAYAFVTQETTTLFLDYEQIDENVRAHLSSDVEIQPYNEFFDYLREYGKEFKKEKRILIGEQASLAVADALGSENITIVRSPIKDAKAIKNETELEGFRQCHIRDGVALARYFAWLEEQLNNGSILNESQGADKLAEYRGELSFFKGLSFPTISSAGPNAAIIHYKPDPADCAIIKNDKIYLCDSGGQFLDGTTDVTRTLHFGNPTEEEKRAFTRVLQGHIAIDTLVFPKGTSGFLLDAFARKALWADGLDYRHGTGHGVGHYLNCHEGPQGMGTRVALNNVSLKPGMTLSNEPGYYADGKFGIRIENIVLVREVQTPNNFGDKGYLGFEHVTLCPIQTKLIARELLSQQERQWLNDYHTETWEKISPFLQDDERALRWLKKECAHMYNLFNTFCYSTKQKSVSKNILLSVLQPPGIKS